MSSELVWFQGWPYLISFTFSINYKGIWLVQNKNYPIPYTPKVRSTKFHYIATYDQHGNE